MLLEQTPAHVRGTLLVQSALQVCWVLVSLQKVARVWHWVMMLWHCPSDWSQFCPEQVPLLDHTPPVQVSRRAW